MQAATPIIGAGVAAIVIGSVALNGGLPIPDFGGGSEAMIEAAAPAPDADAASSADKTADGYDAIPSAM